MREAKWLVDEYNEVCDLLNAANSQIDKLKEEVLKLQGILATKENNNESS